MRTSPSSLETTPTTCAPAPSPGANISLVHLDEESRTLAQTDEYNHSDKQPCTMWLAERIHNAALRRLSTFLFVLLVIFLASTFDSIIDKNYPHVSF